jgi:hypothetical protein
MPSAGDAAAGLCAANPAAAAAARDGISTLDVLACAFRSIPRSRNRITRPATKTSVNPRLNRSHSYHRHRMNRIPVRPTCCHISALGIQDLRRSRRQGKCSVLTGRKVRKMISVSVNRHSGLPLRNRERRILSARHHAERMSTSPGQNRP